MKHLKKKVDILSHLSVLGFVWPLGYRFATVSQCMSKVYLYKNKPLQKGSVWKGYNLLVELDTTLNPCKAEGYHSSILNISEYKTRGNAESLSQVDQDKNLARGYLNKIASSEARGLVFELSLDFFKNLVRSSVCAYTGLPIGKGIDGAPAEYDLTIERIDPLVGYIESNTVAVARVANEAKARLDEFLHSSLPDEVKRKILSQALYRIQKRIKNEKASDNGADAPVDDC